VINPAFNRAARPLRVLVACEFSGAVREAFAMRGHDAWSCDLLDCEKTNLKHLKGDVRAILNDGWDLMIAHPPLHAPGSLWRTLVQGEGCRTGRGAGVRQNAPGRAYPPYRAGEPGQHHFQPDSQARPDHPAVAIRARRGQGYLPVAQEPAEAGSDQRGRGAASGVLAGKPWAGSLEDPQHDVSGNCGRDGRAVGQPGTAGGGVIGVAMTDGANQ